MGDFIDDIIRRETGGDPKGGYTNDPTDSGGETIWGISKRANPDLWVNGPPTYAQSRARFIERYVLPFNGIEDPALLHQLVDWGVTSGPKAVIKVLQQLVGTATDGVLGPISLAKINSPKDTTLFGQPVPGSVSLNLAVRDARVMQYAILAKRRPKDLRFLLGWLNRTLEFR
jgi:lysozyme family protein